MIMRQRLWLLPCCFAWTLAVHVVRDAEDVQGVDPAYLPEHWTSVSFPPVDPFWINTHEPVTQDIYISGSAHAGKSPWDEFIWDRIVSLSHDKPEGSIFIDVGANLGYFSLMAASLGYRVVAFEPMSRNARKLAQSVARNNFEVTLYQNAVSDISGQRVSLIETSPFNQGNGQVTTGGTPDINGVYGDAYVSTVTLSETLLFLPNEPIDAYIVKIDVEGLEADVIKGAQHWICAAWVPHIIMEFSDITRANRYQSTSNMFSFMRRAGYTVSDVNVQSDAPLDYKALEAGDFSTVPGNIFFSLDQGKKEC